MRKVYAFCYWCGIIVVRGFMNKKLNTALEVMIRNILEILNENILSIYIYGSCVLGDFKLGWSDIDILVLTKKSLSDNCAKKLLNLRQDLLKNDSKNKYYRSFEGAILSLNSFVNKSSEKIVYWGTKGESIKETYNLDSFSKKELLESAILLYGSEVRNQFEMPTYNDLCQDIYRHYKTIREHAQKTGRNLYSYGWFLDISRCIYTLKTGEIISKTKAGEWALKNKLCPDVYALKMALKVRKKPVKYKHRTFIMDYAETLGNSVQKYADILEKYLKHFNLI